MNKKLLKRIENINNTIEDFKDKQKLYGGYDYKKFLGRQKAENIAKDDVKYNMFLKNKKEGQRYYKERERIKKDIEKYNKKVTKKNSERQELKEKIKKDKENIENERKKNKNKKIVDFIKEVYNDKPYDKQFVLNEFRTGFLKIPNKIIEEQDEYALDVLVRNHTLEGLVTSIQEEGSNMVRGGLFKYNTDIPELEELQELIMKDKNFRENTMLISQFLYEKLIPLKYGLLTESEDMPSEYGKIYEKGEGKSDRKFFKEVASVLVEEYKKLM